MFLVQYFITVCLLHTHTCTHTRTARLEMSLSLLCLFACCCGGFFSLYSSGENESSVFIQQSSNSFSASHAKTDSSALADIRHLFPLRFPGVRLSSLIAANSPAALFLGVSKGGRPVHAMFTCESFSHRPGNPPRHC